MHHRLVWTGVPLGALALALAVPACGSYDAPHSTGGTSSGGNTSAGGTTGSSGGTANGSGGTANSGGADAAGGADTGSGGIPEPPEASCENVTPCGGDAEGVWFAQKSCLPLTGVVDLTPLAIGCTEGAITSGEIEVTGNWTVNADLSLSDNSNSITEVVFELEPECLNISGTVSKCPNVGLPLTSIGFDDVTCVDSTETTGGCTCTGTANQTGGMGYTLSFNAETSGTYTIADNTITVSGTGPEDLAYSYCVDGPFMIVTPTTAGAIGTIDGTIVLQKQD